MNKLEKVFKNFFNLSIYKIEMKKPVISKSLE